jgi:pimeloyl-ACP methyl ester carboxylesterase
MFALGAAPADPDPAPRQPPVGAAAPTERHTPTPTPATTTTTATPTTAATSTISFTAPLDPNPPALAAFYGQRIVWKKCREGSCATVRVPVAYDEPDGGTIAISLFRLKARDGAKRKGTLFVNPGGPGVSGIDFVRDGADYFGKPVRQVWDIVGFDPRGMGASGGFDCFTDRELDQMYAADLTPDTKAERRALLRAHHSPLESCVRRGGTLALNMGTESVVRDLDILRDAVGDDRLNYLGASYGTLIGSIYAGAFTSRVGLMVLDSAFSQASAEDLGDAQVGMDASAERLAEDLEAMMGDFAENCIAHGCPLGSTVEQVSRAVVGILDGLDQRPARTVIPSLPLLTEGWGAVAVRFAIGQPAAWQDLADGLVEVRDGGDGTTLAILAMIDVGRENDGTYSGASFGKNHVPVTCADWPVSAADRMTPSAAVFAAHPLLGRLEGTVWVAQCEGWPGRTRSNLLVDAVPATPVLLIGNEGDPVTPIGATEDLASMLLGSRMVAVEAGGHGAYGRGNRCADRAVEDYLVRGVAPPQQVTSCPGN